MMRMLILLFSLVAGESLLVPGFPNEAFAATGKRKEMTHLSFFNGEIHAHFSWEVGPHMQKESIARVEWRSGASHESVVPSEKFEVELWMPSMDHGSSPVIIEAVSEEAGKKMMGVFRVSKIVFSMKGEWEVRLTLTKENKKTETKVVKIKI